MGAGSDPPFMRHCRHAAGQPAFHEDVLPQFPSFRFISLLRFSGRRRIHLPAQHDRGSLHQRHTDDRLLLHGGPGNPEGDEKRRAFQRQEGSDAGNRRLRRSHRPCPDIHGGKPWDGCFFRLGHPYRDRHRLCRRDTLHPRRQGSGLAESLPYRPGDRG